MRKRYAVLVCVGSLLLASLAALAETRREQSVGVAAITADDAIPRDAAMEAAVRGAVVRTATDLLPGGFAPAGAEPDAWLEKRLGDPYEFVASFRIIEDRGTRPAMFAREPGVSEEYVVLAEVHVDVDAVRDRLESLGLLGRGGGGSSREVMLVVEGLSSYRPLQMLRDTLREDRGVRGVVPVEFSDGRAVLAVQADRSAAQLIADAARRAPEGLKIVTVDQNRSGATLLLEWRPPAR